MDAGEFEPAKGLTTHQSARVGTVDVEVAAFHLVFDAFNVGGTARKQSACERVIHVVGGFDGLINILYPKQRDQWAKEFHLAQFRLEICCFENGGRHKVALFHE